MKYFFKSMMFKFKYNRLFVYLAIKTNAKIRRRQRQLWMSDDLDPYFIMRSKSFQNGIQSELTDKLKVKEFVEANNYALVPKTLFTFDRKGVLTSGSIPRVGNVVLKSSNGSGYVKIIEAASLTPKILADIYGEFYFKSKYYGLFNDEMMYSKNEPILYAEEFLGDNITDYKIHISDKGHMYLGCFDRKNKLVVSHFLNGTSFGGYDGHSDSGTKLSKNDKKIFDSLLPIAKKIQKKLDRYVRVDFYTCNNNIYIGELTFMSGAGELFTDLIEPSDGFVEFKKIIDWN